ncbi:hypothetical protein ACU4GD_08810 [Cupriavidus basilensis]
MERDMIEFAESLDIRAALGMGIAAQARCVSALNTPIDAGTGDPPR